MFSQYSWSDFLQVVGGGSLAYYVVVAWRFYREDIREFFTRIPLDRSNRTEVPPADGEYADLVNVVSYSDASARTSGTTATDKSTPKHEEAPIPETAEPGSVGEPKPVPVEAPLAENVPDFYADATQARVDAGVGDDGKSGVLLAEHTATTEFWIPLGGGPEPTFEMDLGQLLEAAKEVEKLPNGSVFAKLEAGPETRRLADVINQQRQLTLAEIRSTRPSQSDDEGNVHGVR